MIKLENNKEFKLFNKSFIALDESNGDCKQFAICMINGDFVTSDAELESYFKAMPKFIEDFDNMKIEVRASCERTHCAYMNNYEA